MTQRYPEFPYRSCYADIDGQRMHYIDEGEGQVIVMVHGNPTWSYYYRHIIERLKRTHRVIALDHIGSGLSDKPEDEGYYRLRQHIDNLFALLDQLAITKYSLIVHDWGGAIGMGLATRYPERVERVVILNTAAFRSQRIPLRIRVCRWPVIGRLLVRGLNGFAWPATFMAVCKPLRKEIAAAYIAPYDSWSTRVGVSSFVADIPLEESHPSYSELLSVEEGLTQLRDMQIPMLILWGGKDFCFTKHFFDEWKRRFPEASTRYFEDGGHYILEDKKDECGEEIENFFQDH